MLLDRHRKLAAPEPPKYYRRTFVAANIDASEHAALRAVADDVHGANMSEAIRAAILSYLAARIGFTPPPGSHAHKLLAAVGE